MQQTVILIHGYFRTARDMRFLAHYLEQRGYLTHSLKLPSTMGSLAQSSSKVANCLQALDLSGAGTLHLVGHSMGGLIIRHCLARYSSPHLGRCVFLATPNAGTRLADIGVRILPAAFTKPLQCLRTNAAPIRPPLNSPLPEIGVIAGNKANLLLGRLLPTENDGRVEVHSTRLPGMKDWIVLPFGHHQLHHRDATALLVERFLRTGSFACQ